MEVRGVQDVEKFIELSGFSVSRRGGWADIPAREQRRKLTNVLWRERSLVRHIYSDLADLKPGAPFQIARGGVTASSGRPTARTTALGG